MATNYRVKAPYVLLKVRDQAGKSQVAGFYEGAILSDAVVDPEFLTRHLERDWIEKVDEPVAEPVAKPVKPETPAPDPDKVPDGTADEVLTWVGDNKERAESALTAEQAGQKRKTLIDQLKKRAGQA